MNKVFADYSHYYDLLNSGKNYGEEVDYILALVESYGKIPCRRLLDLGCGTGLHDLGLAKRGLEVTGVDRSGTMLEQACNKLAREPELPVNFILGDIADLHLGERFDLVLSLFHVISYQTSNERLARTFRVAAEHLNQDGLFIFDFWYGPAVLHQKPEVREKHFENDRLVLKRKAEPLLNQESNTVAVNFTIDITDKDTMSSKTLQETHLMRYLFLPEIESLLADAGLTCIRFEEWLTGQRPGQASWSVCCVACKAAAGI